MINFGGGGANKANWVLMITMGLSISDISTRSQICFFCGGGGVGTTKNLVAHSWLCGLPEEVQGHSWFTGVISMHSSTGNKISHF